jgi:ribose transport system substrate-binding protein
LTPFGSLWGVPGVGKVGAGSDEKLVELLQDDPIAGLVVEDPFRMGL